MSKQGYSRNLDLVPVRLVDRRRNEATTKEKEREGNFFYRSCTCTYANLTVAIFFFCQLQLICLVLFLRI